MSFDAKRLLVCTCEGTMRLDGKALATACAADGPLEIHTQLCRSQLENFRAALGGDEPVTVACTQETPLFEETRADAAPDTPVRYVNIRERAGWSEEGARAVPKIAALLAEGAVEVEAARTVTLASEGVCLVYGKDEVALDAARQLAGRLDVALLLTGAEEVAPPLVSEIPLFKGRISVATGHLGAFEIVVDDYAPLVVSSRASLVFGIPRGGAKSACDLILDLSGEEPLFPAPEKRDGYFRPNPGNPAAVQHALFELVDLVGEFEKPIYVDFKPELCTHSRSEITGCTRCIDTCPASAIQPDGDVVAIDPYICGGCGGCNSVCPTGAAGYTMPPTTSLLARARELLLTYEHAGGERSVLLVHDERWGEETIHLMARLGRGLPVHVLPFAVNEVTQIGFDFLAGALAYGAARIVVLVPPQRREEITGLESQAAIAAALMSGLFYDGERVSLLAEADPEAIADALYDLSVPAPVPPAKFLPMGGKRALLRLALSHLHAAAPGAAETIPLPEGAPFGTVEIDTDGCTLCLSCVGACPTGAMQDNPDRPMLRFMEDACVQCGLCRLTCPESVVRLTPRLNFAEEAREAALIKEEEPFECVRCGKSFGTKGSIELIVEKLAGKHAMFQDESAIERIKMCEDCRVVAGLEAGDEAFAGGERTPPRTTEDYLREREEIEAARARHRAEAGKAGNGSDEGSG